MQEAISRVPNSALLWVYAGQLFTRLGEEERGGDTWVRWRTRCAKCGVSITSLTPRDARKAKPMRYCPEDALLGDKARRR